MNSTDQPKNFGVPFAQNGKKNTIPKIKSTSQKANEASYDTGFPEITMELVSAGGLPPLGQDVNGVLYDMSNAVRWGSAGGFFNFDTALSNQIGGYPKGALLWNQNKTAFFLSLVDNNTQNPDTATSLTQWRIFKPVDIVQTTGNSTENAMSQKASTDIFAKKNSKELITAGRFYAIGTDTDTNVEIRMYDTVDPSKYISFAKRSPNNNVYLYFSDSSQTVTIDPDGNIVGDIWEI